MQNNWEQQWEQAVGNAEQKKQLGLCVSRSEAMELKLCSAEYC